MHCSYSDILARISEAPKWWDENGVPRFCDFEPSKITRFAPVCCLLLIKCQECCREFNVCVSQDRYEVLLHQQMPLSEAVVTRQLKYGDPPNVGCCVGGPTMSSVPVRVLEFWRQDTSRGNWERVSEFERDVMPDWATEEQAP